MVKITFIGAGSTIFAKNILGDAMLTPSLYNAEIALYDINETRLKESEIMLNTINKNSNEGRASITAYPIVKRHCEVQILLSMRFKWVVINQVP